MARKCRLCKSELPPVKACINPYQGKGFCNLNHMAEYGIKKATEQRQRARKKRQTEDKERIKSKNQLIKEAQREFNRFIRLRDHADPCICCGSYGKGQEWLTGGKWDAGHFLSRGAYPELRFNEDNCHKQLKSCNAGSGKSHYGKNERTVAQKYEVRLIKKIGSERVEALKSYSGMPHWSADELREIRDSYRKKANELQKTIDKNNEQNY